MEKIVYLPWNIVAQNFTPHDQLKSWVQREIKKLERHLTNFPHQQVHLYVLIEMHKASKKFTASLTLRLPSNLLNAKCLDEDPISAVSGAMRALIREVDRFKSQLRHIKERRRYRQKVDKIGERYVEFAPEPLPEAAAPKDISNLLSQVIEDNYQQLFGYVKRQLENLEANGEIPINSIDAEAALDEAIKVALSTMKSKPDEVGYLPWLYQLINEEIRRRVKLIQRQKSTVIPVEELEEKFTEPTTIAPLIESMLNEPLDEESFPSSKPYLRSAAPAPDEEIGEREFIERLIEGSRGWDSLERDVFDLHFIEGFEPQDCSIILKKPVDEIISAIQNIHRRIRELIIEEASF
ncbi:MAG: HPF/RaiA family ribosome-associated protein [Verrucomicrobiia bacterium]